MIATARVLASQGTGSRGTAFAISRDLALTAFHVIGDRSDGTLHGDHVDLLFDGFPVRADVCGKDNDADVAVLQLRERLPPGLEPAALVTSVEPGETWSSPAFPAALAGQVSLRGTIVAVEGKLPGTTGAAIQLHCDQSAAGSPLPLIGASGGAVLVDGSSAAGIIRWNPTHPDRPGDAVGGIVYACPIEAAVRCCPGLLRPLLVPRARRAERLAALLFQQADNGRLPLVREMEPHEVGATPTRYSERGLAPYVPRNVDAKVRSIVREGRFALVVGPSKSGKSRTAFEALRDERSKLLGASFLQARLLTDALAELIGMDAREPLCDGELVIWLDDLDEYLRAGGNFDPAVWNRIRRRSPRALVVATMTQQRLDALLAEGGDTARFLRQVTQGARVYLRPELDPGDLAEARRLYPYEDFTAGRRIAARLTRGDELVGSLRRAEDEQPHGFAVTMAAINWRRIGLSGAVSRELLRRLYEIELTEHFPHLEPSDEGFEEGLAWALTMAVSHVSLLAKQPGADDTYRVLDYAEQVVRDEAWPLPEGLWEFAITTQGQDEVWQVGVTADAEQCPDIARRAYQELLRRGDPSGALGIGRQLAHAGEMDEARSWFQRAIQDGLSWVMVEFGVLLAQYDRDESVRWHLRALEAGFPEAAHNLGTLAQEIDHNSDDALYWYETATTAGVQISRIALATLLIESNRLDEAVPILDQLRSEPPQDEAGSIAAVLADRGDVQEAEWWWRRCAETGNISSVRGLAKFLADNHRPAEAVELLAPLAATDDIKVVNDYAVSLQRAGRLADAERQYRRIAALGNPVVLQNIAELLVDQERVPEAEEWYQRAADAGNDYAIGCLAELAGRRGDAENELRLYQEAATREVPIAHACLGRILAQQGQLDKAVEHLKTAAEAGEASAADNLGSLCADRGAVAEAYYWYLLAAELSPEAAPLWNLGMLLWSERRLGQAAWAFDEAAKRGAADVERILDSLSYEDEQRLQREDALRANAGADAHAAYDLGVALAFSGALPEARKWLRRAADAGITSASLRLGDLEAELGHVTALSHFQVAAQAGDPVGMVRLGRLLLKQGDAEGARLWLERADREGTAAAAAYLAVLHESAGDRLAADKWLERVAEVDDIDCLLGRAELAAKRGDQAVAARLFVAAANAGSPHALLEVVSPFSRPDPRRATRWLQVAASWSPLIAWVFANLLARMDLLDEAREAADFAAAAGAPEAKRHLVDVLIKNGDLVSAEAICRELLAQTGEPIEEANLALVCSKQGKSEEALRHYRAAVYGGLVEANAGLADMLIQAGKTAEAMPVLEVAIQHGDPNALATRGLVAERNGDLADAEQWYRRAQPASVPAAQRLAKLCLDRGDTEAVVAWLLPSATDGNPTSAVQLAAVYEEKVGDAERAEHWYREAAARTGGFAAYRVAKIHAGYGDDEIAERWLRRAVEDGYGTAAHDIGEIMLRRGLATVAEQWYRKAFELGHIEAAFDVGAIMAARGLDEQAQRWWAKALISRGIDVPADELLANRQISVQVVREDRDGTGQKQYVVSL